MKVLLLLILSILSSAWAQNATTGALAITASVPKPLKAAGSTSSGWGSKTFELKNVDAEQIRQLFSGRANVLQVEERLNLLIASGSQSFLDEVESAVKRFDIPAAIAKNVQLTFYLIAPVAQAPQGTRLPPELDGIDKQISLPGGAKALRVADSQILRIRTGQSGEVIGLAAPAEGFATISQIRFRFAWVGADKGKNVVSLEGLQVNFNVPGVPGKDVKAESRMISDVDLPEKQGIILSRGGTDKPFVLLVRAEIAG